MNLKKLLLIIGTLLAAYSVCHAAPQESDLRSKTIVVHSTWSVAAGISTNTVLISLSSTTWPNPTDQHGYINITNINIQIDKLAASSPTVKMGVITYIDASTGSVKYFFDLASSRNVSNTLNNLTYSKDNSFRNLKVIPATANSGFDGLTPYLISNDIISGSTLYQTDVYLPGVNNFNSGMFNVLTTSVTYGNVLPTLGDVVVTINNPDVTNGIGVYVDVDYHYEQR